MESPENFYRKKVALPKSNTLRKVERDLHALTATPEYTDAKAGFLADMAAKALSEMTLARAKADRQVFEVLTPEQRKQLAEMKPAERGPRGRGDGPRGAVDGGKPSGR